MLGNCRTRASERPIIRAASNGTRPTGGRVDAALVNGIARKVNRKPKPRKRTRRR